MAFRRRFHQSSFGKTLVSTANIAKMRQMKASEDSVGSRHSNGGKDKCTCCTSTSAGSRHSLCPKLLLITWQREESSSCLCRLPQSYVFQQPGFNNLAFQLAPTTKPNRSHRPLPVWAQTHAALTNVLSWVIAWTSACMLATFWGLESDLTSTLNRFGFV